MEIRILGATYFLRKNSVLKASPALIIMGVIFYFSHLPGDSIDFVSAFKGADKLLHALVYALLAVSCIPTAKSLIKKYSLRYVAVGIVFFCLLYGISDEFHQSFIPYRSASGWDVLADTAGATLTVWIWSRRMANSLPCKRSLL
ncbi:MAG: VanZ family protein [Thermodesulfobacteriota bacterium]|nr:VanZ family protein [Thermodesulfobacteriota bacterium]